MANGVGDFGKSGGRYRPVLRAIRKKHRRNRKIPFSIETLKWLYGEFLRTWLNSPARIELFTGAVLGFRPLLRVGEIGKLGMSDLRLGRDDNGLERLTLIIRNIKTDQFDGWISKLCRLYPAQYAQ